MSSLSGWGQYPRVQAHLAQPRSPEALRALAQSGGTAIARGNGRAYGDSAINSACTIDLRAFNRMLQFCPDTGQLVAEAGVVLGDVIATFLPRGWFPYVTPGTKFVTLGGAVAADVHGKNHHKEGGFGAYVDWLDLLDHNGQVLRCSRSENPQLFQHTLGGMGLTGIIWRVALRLRPVSSGWIKQTRHVARDISHAMALFEQAQDATYSVAWIDCLQRGPAMGRALVMLGEHAAPAELPAHLRATPFAPPKRRQFHMPITPPSWLLNTATVRAFNALYYWQGARGAGRALVDWDSYFYPLDAILGWNKIYGRRGFAQFQCVIPLAQAEAGLRALLAAIAAAGAGSFLAVLKRLGAQDSPLSFPMAGYTLALDFPVTAKTLALMQQLDAITCHHGGRIYLAKDSRMARDMFHQTEPRAAPFAQYRQATGAAGAWASAQSERLGL